jgi:hypothetical protein
MPRAPFGTQHQVEIVALPGLIAAEGAVRLVNKIKRSRPKPLRGATPRAGADTPLWNKLAAAAAKSLRRRGDKARLARILGISRQRLHLLLIAKTAYPDAERTLLLMEWVEARKQGLDLG